MRGTSSRHGTSAGRRIGGQRREDGGAGNAAAGFLIHAHGAGLDDWTMVWPNRTRDLVHVL